MALDACAAGLLKPVASELIIQEAVKGLRLKSKPTAMHRFSQFLALPALEIAGIPEPGSLEPYAALIHSKDCHVLASAVLTRCRLLMTLDRKHFFTPVLQQAALPLTILTPGQLLEFLANDKPA